MPILYSVDGCCPITTQTDAMTLVFELDYIDNLDRSIAYLKSVVYIKEKK